MATATSAAVRRGHSFDGGGGKSAQGLDRIGSGVGERKISESNWKKKQEVVDDSEDEDEKPLCIVRQVRKGDGAAHTAASPAASSVMSRIGGSGGAGGSSVTGGRAEGGAGASSRREGSSVARKDVGESGVERKRVLVGRAGGSGGGIGAPVTKKVKVEEIIDVKKREPDPYDEDEDDIPLARRMGIAKSVPSPTKKPPVSESFLTKSLAAAKEIMDARKKGTPGGLASMANLSRNGAMSPTKASIPRPSTKESQGRILNPGLAGRSEQPLERKVESKPVIKALTGNSAADSDDSDDDKPLSHRKFVKAPTSRESKPNDNEVKDLGIKKRPAGQTVPSSNPPAVKKLKVMTILPPPRKPSSLQSPKSGSFQSPKRVIKRDPVSSPKPTARGVEPDSDDDGDDVPLAQRIPSLAKSSTVKKSPAVVKERDRDDDDDDNVPLVNRMASAAVSKPRVVTTLKKPASSSGKSITKKALEKRRKGNTTVRITKKVTITKQLREKGSKMPDGDDKQKWETLEHNGVIFPPPYQPHRVKMLYNGRPVDLTPEQEEVATMFAVMKDTDYASKPKFIENFWADWQPILGKQHVIQDFELCDFTPIYNWHQAEKEKKKSLTPEEKKRMKEEKLKVEDKYMWALVNGVKEKVGNFRVEPPGLFRGRGEHPKMGKLKKRIFPENIVINIGKGAPVPPCPMPGHKWKEVRHDNTVTWLAYWNDPINSKEFKYVFLAASSSLKGQSDMEKYEKARVLKDHIENIRTAYTKNFSSGDVAIRQIAVATYLIDRLALRAGNEKDDDEADTVGCCSLKVEHVLLVPPKSLTFDFLGKDSIRYFNTVEVEEKVYKAIGDFQKGKEVGGDLFDRLDTTKLNQHLKGIMPALTAKVFRTYNASITLDRLLQDTVGNHVVEKIADYQRANKEVAILCNHQRTVSKSHSSQMERIEAKMNESQELLQELKRDLDRVRKGKPPLKDSDGKLKRNQSVDVIRKRITQVEQKIEKMDIDRRIKDDLKTVALGTSKINYMDPRITVAWCKKHEVPIEKIFNKSLLAKFAWAMDVEPDYRF